MVSTWLSCWLDSFLHSAFCSLEPYILFNVLFSFFLKHSDDFSTFIEAPFFAQKVKVGLLIVLCLIMLVVHDTDFKHNIPLREYQQLFYVAIIGCLSVYMALFYDINVCRHLKD